MEDPLVKLIQQETRTLRDLALIIADYYTKCPACRRVRLMPIPRSTTMTHVHDAANNILLSYWCRTCLHVCLYDGRPLPQGPLPAVYFEAPSLGIYVDKYSF